MVNSWHVDDETFERFREYLKLLAHSQVDSWLDQRVDASDLVQQTMLDAVARAEQFRGTSEHELLGWLRQILANNIIDAMRFHGRKKRAAGRTFSIDEEVSHSFMRIDALATGSRSTPSQHAMNNEQLLRLPRALDALPDAQRQAIILHHLKGLKLSETATRLGKSEAAVGGLLHRGLRRLTRLLEE